MARTDSIITYQPDSQDLDFIPFTNSTDIDGMSRPTDEMFSLEGDFPLGPDRHLLRMHSVVKALRLYYQPVVIVIGVVFNTTSLAVFLGSKLRRLSSVRYLTACTAIDLLFLLVLLVSWLSDYGLPVYKIGAFCHVTTFLASASSFLSVWYTCAYSVNRFLVSYFPGWERELCTRMKTNAVIVMTSLLALVVFLNMSLTVGVVRLGSRTLCTPLPRFMPALKVLNHVDIVLNNVIPYVILIPIFVLCSVRCYKDRSWVARRHLVTRTRITFDDKSLTLGQTRVFITYLGLFLLLNLPLLTERLRQMIKEITVSNNRISQESIMMLQFFYFLYYTRYSLNFFIHLVAYKGFRATIHKALRTRMRRGREGLRTLWVRHKSSNVNSDMSYEDQTEDESCVALFEPGPSKRAQTALWSWKNAFRTSSAISVRDNVTSDCMSHIGLGTIFIIIHLTQIHLVRL